MNRTVIWGVNGGLFLVCCWLLATLINRVLAEVVLPEAAAVAPADAAAPAPARAFADRQVILDRNLFNASVLGGTQVVEAVEEDLEATKLPLRLLGTAAAADTRRSWAAVEDLDTKDHQVVRVNDSLKSATVMRIERRRIVLQNGAQREELALEEASEARQAVRVPARQRTAGRPPPRGNTIDRVRRLAENRFSVNRADVETAVSNPGDLFSQARILPKYENGEMVGVQLNAIKAGSMFESIGIQNGDTIRELNGIRVTSQQDSAAVLRELTEAKEFSVVVLGADGQERTLTYEIQE